MKTNIILEALFTGADEEEIKRRDEIAPPILRAEWMDAFLANPRVKKRSDGSYDVDDHVHLEGLKLTKLPVKFNIVTGSFWCNENELTTLEGAPKEVGKDFVGFNNKLTSLEHGPQKVGQDFWVNSNNLTSLKHSPKSINGDYWCSKNPIKNLVGMTQSRVTNLICFACKLTSLKGAAKEVIHKVDVSYNNLTSLEGAPRLVGTQAEDKTTFECFGNVVEFTEEEIKEKTGATNIHRI